MTAPSPAWRAGAGVCGWLWLLEGQAGEHANGVNDACKALFGSVLERDAG
jgi:hypothetical protein